MWDVILNAVQRCSFSSIKDADSQLPLLPSAMSVLWNLCFRDHYRHQETDWQLEKSANIWKGLEKTPWTARHQGQWDPEAGNTQGEPTKYPNLLPRKRLHRRQHREEAGSRRRNSWRWWVWRSGRLLKAKVLDKSCTEEPQRPLPGRGPLISAQACQGTYIKPEERATQKHNRKDTKLIQQSCLQSRKLHLHREIESTQKGSVSPTKAISETQKDQVFLINLTKEKAKKYVRYKNSQHSISATQYKIKYANKQDTRNHLRRKAINSKWPKMTEEARMTDKHNETVLHMIAFHVQKLKNGRTTKSNV